MNLTAETMSEHRARWFVYTGEGSERIPCQSMMRGTWPGFDVVCSCGWETRTGGGTRRYVAGQLADHRYEAQWESAR
jgi:hypothetical protein